MNIEKWRLILDSPAEGAWNMAVDEAILEATAAFIQPPTLRLYAWEPYCLSLGYAQPISDIDNQRLEEKEWGIVRRPTGGKAILHADELTYCICASKENSHVEGSILESYKHLSKGLLSALAGLNLQAISEPHKKPSERNTTNPVCFEIPSDYEITLDRKKIIGSAQARKKKGVLQHGAIPIFGDITRIVEVLAFGSMEEREVARSKLSNRATTLEPFSPSPFTWDQVADAMKTGFVRALGIEFVIEELSIPERQRAKQLYQEKYNNPSWTERV